MMKKVICFLLVLVMVLAISCPVLAATPSAGDGGNPPVVPDTPATGDMLLTTLLAVMAVAAVGLAALVVWYRKRSV